MSEWMREQEKRMSTERSLRFLQHSVVAMPLSIREVPALSRAQTSPGWTLEVLAISGVGAAIIGLLMLITLSQRKLRPLLILSLACLVVAEVGSRARQFGWIAPSTHLATWFLSTVGLWSIVRVLQKSMRDLNQSRVVRLCRRWYWVSGVSVVAMLFGSFASSIVDRPHVIDLEMAAFWSTVAALGFLWFLLGRGIQNSEAVETIEEVFD